MTLKSTILGVVKANWGAVSLTLILAFIIFLNLKPGYTILGNDNFSPELNPTLTLERSIFSPAWRTYRVLGIPSDSEQSDIFRASIFWVVEKILPTWVISQGYLFFTFFIASFSMASLTVLILKNLLNDRYKQESFLLGGLFYMSSLLTSWIYFFPVQLFIAAYAFLPLVLWRLACFFERQSIKNVFFLLVSSLFLSTAALTATMFIICAFVVLIFTLIFTLGKIPNTTIKKAFGIGAFGLIIIFTPQAYWTLPFITYVKSNTDALQNSAINREITSTTIATEAKYNTAINVPRFYSAWMDTKENNNNFTFPYRDWYKNSKLATVLSFLPLIFAFIGSFYLIKKKKNRFLILTLTGIFGWFLIKGINPPFGFLYSFLEGSPVFAQVFRWQSSKMWPFLATTISILGTLGALLILQSFSKKKGFSLLFLVIIVFGFLAFVYPYFRSDLVRKQVFVDVPKEYFALKDYLEKTDKFSRIYLAPEANTLYFRNYSWGFWGSVVLNYILPNPIVEKALIIGSNENEQAFKVLTNAYYSENPKTFFSALNLYDTPFILDDQYAFKGDVGYAYNDNVEKKVIRNNPDFEKVWQEGKLTLYKLKNYYRVGQDSATNISFQNDFTKLNTIQANLNQSSPYYSNQVPGAIYPFALNFDNIEFNQGEIVTKTKIKGQDAKYMLNIDKDLLSNSPSQLVYKLDIGRIYFYPLLPYIRINNSVFGYQLPFREYKTKNPASFITINDQVVDERNQTLPKFLSVPYQKLSLKEINIKSWLPVFNPVDPSVTCKKSIKEITCGTGEILVEKPTIIELNVVIKSNDSAMATLCLESKYKKSCLNKNATAFVNGETTSVVLIPQVLQSGDQLKVFLNFKLDKDDTQVSVERFLINKYQENETPQFLTESSPQAEQVVEVAIKNNDILSLHVPVLEGENSWQLSPDGVFIPEASEESGGKITQVQDGLNFNNKESSSSIFPKLGLINSTEGLGLVAISTQNKSGIPIDISINEQNREYKIWERRIFPQKTTQSLDLFALPDGLRSYSLVALSTGLGPVSTVNAIHKLYFQVIPKSWYTIALVPASKTLSLSGLLLDGNSTYKGIIDIENTIVSIPQAFSPNWNLIINGDSQREAVLINGWKQGWVVGKTGNAKVSFGPNTLAYLGFLPIFGIIGWLVVKILAKFFSRKSAQTGRPQK